MLTRRMIAWTSRVLVLVLTVGFSLLSLPALASQGEVVRISASSAGVQGNGISEGAVVSDDGRYLVFTSKATNLVAGDTNGHDDIFRFDRISGVLMAVSVTPAGKFVAANHAAPAISSDGRFVAFWSEGAFDAADDQRSADVFVKDMLTGAVERLSVAPDGSNRADVDRVNNRSILAISDDGRWVAFGSNATDLVIGDVVDDQTDLFLRDRALGTTILLSTEAAGGPGASSGFDAVISGSGPSAVAGFAVKAPNNAGTRLVLRMLDSGFESTIKGITTSRPSILAVARGGGSAIVTSAPGALPSVYNVTAGTLTSLPNNVDWAEVGTNAFSSDLRYYVVAQTGPFAFHVFDRETGALDEVPRSATGATPDQDVVPSSISDDGTIVGFATVAGNLVTGDTNGISDSFYVRIGKGTFADDDGNPFEADIEWLFDQGITLGCGFDRFCPRAPVTREQMASFLVRALDLPASTTDAFTDDDSSLHQADINALAAAGVTQGCAQGRFCPTSAVSRQEMASFLVRALDLPAATLDYFTDDDGSVHEQDINALFLSEVTLGCGDSVFCPSGIVLREQMAAFLHRALS